MKKKILELIKEYRLSIIIALIVALIGIFSIIIFSKFNNNSSLKSINNANYILKYDSGWKIKESKNDKILLTHDNNASLKVEIIELDNEYKYHSIEDLIDEIIYNIEQQNPNYNLISKKEDLLTKLQFNGYKMLYENGNNQLMVNVYKKSDKLIMFIYETTNEYFDILLDSVHNIVYNFDTKGSNFDLKSNIKLETENIDYKTDDELDKLISDTKNYEIANKNYKVNYSIPSVFELSEINSSYNYFNLKGLNKKNMTLNVDVMNRNIYEFLDKNNSLTLYKNYKIYRENKDYTNFKESVAKLDNDFESYIYKNSYNSKGTTYNSNFEKEEYQKYNENVLLIYALNPNHILVINISSTDTGITEKLLENIKVEKSENYSSYVKINSKDGFILGELKKYSDYSKTKTITINTRVPDSYREYEKDSNIYVDRYYGLNYDEENDMYDYEIHFNLNISSDTDKIADNISSSFSKVYGECNNLVKSDNITIGNKEFIVYNGGYTNLGGIMFTNINRFRYYINKKVLMYKLSNGGYFVIEISGNSKEITNETIANATNFEINEN